MPTDAPSQQGSMKRPCDVEEDDRPAEEVKHAFVHLSGYSRRPAGTRHGSALYDNVTGKGRWILTFHYNADIEYAKELTFLQVPGTASYLNLQETAKSYNALLITRTEW